LKYNADCRILNGGLATMFAALARRKTMSGLQNLLEEIRALEKRVREEVRREAEEFGYTLERGRRRFSIETRARHRLLRKKLREYIRGASIPVILTAPLIYSLVLPLALLDLTVTVYQWVCFPVYGIPRVRRGDYFVYDRIHLDYLNIIEKFHCQYCSYANGLLAYVVEIAGRTEQFWCPIKHAERVRNRHSRYFLFLAYGDGERYASELQSLRRQFGDLEPSPNREKRSREKKDEQ
jgi:hypothetical protein